MNYRIVKITTYYRDFLAQYYESNPHTASLSYAEQHAHLMSQAFGWSDYFALHLNTLGNDAFELVANAKPMQRRWADENGFAGSDEEIVFEQIKKLKPDVVFFQDTVTFGKDFITKVKTEIPSVRLALGWCCTIYSDEHIEVFREYDSMLVCSEHFAADFRRRGLPVHQMHHAFEPSLLPRIQENNPYPENDFTFIGSLIPGSEFHTLRQELIEHLIRSNIGLEIFANLTVISPADLFLRRSAYVVNVILKSMGLKELAHRLPMVNKAYTLKEMPRNLKNISEIQRIAKPPLYGIEMFKALSKSRIGFNVHSEAAGDYAANVRIFEVTGVGSCLLTDWKKNMHELFEEDKEVVLFKTIDECKEKLRWLLDHPAGRNDIAVRGQQRVLRDHTYQHRAGQLHSLIQELLMKRTTK